MNPILSPLDLAVRPTEYLAQQSRAYAAGRPVVTQQPAFVIYHDSFNAVLGPSPTIKVLAKRDWSFAHEAGVYDPNGDQVWITSNLQLTTDDGEFAPFRVEISRVGLTTGEVQSVNVPGVRMGNGACPFGDRLLFCDQGHGEDHPSQLVVVDRDGKSKILINNFNGRPFNSLNDVVVLPSPGSLGPTVWFTDPTYGYEQGFRPSPALPPHVYVFDPSTGHVRVVADDFKHPNGIAFSPDGSVCYITDSSHIHGTGERFPSRPATIYSFDVKWPADALEEGFAAPFLVNKRVFAFTDNFVPDGIKCDKLGNVYAGCGDGLHVWNRFGILIGKIVLGAADDNPSAGCANFCFAPGGRIACFAEDRVYLVEGLQVEGALQVMIAE